MELDLKADAIDVFLAVAEVAQRAGLATEVVQSARPPDRPCRVAARLAQPAASAPAAPGARFAEVGPTLLVYEFHEVGVGRVRVRITQCGFGDQAAWDAAFGGWYGREGPARWLPSVRRPGGVPDLPPVDTFPQWGQLGMLPGRSLHSPVVAALVRAIEAACVRLGAMRHAAVRIPTPAARW